MLYATGHDSRLLSVTRARPWRDMAYRTCDALTNVHGGHYTRDEDNNGRHGKRAVPVSPLPLTLPAAPSDAAFFRSVCGRLPLAQTLLPPRSLLRRRSVRPKEISPVKRRSVIARPSMAIGQSVRASPRRCGSQSVRGNARADWSPSLKAYVHGESFLGSVSFSALCAYAPYLCT